MSRPPLPPFNAEAAAQKVRLAEDAWNSRDPVRVAQGYSVDSIWRNRAEFITGREQIEAFLEQKQAGLLRELQKQPELGRFNFPGYMGPDPNNIMRLGTDIRYAMSFAGEDGGRRIVIITPRVIGFREQRDQPRTIDYPFTLFEMRFDKAVNGEGKMAYGTQILFDKKKNNIVLENYSSEPVRLNQLRLQVRK